MWGLAYPWWLSRRLYARIRARLEGCERCRAGKVGMSSSCRGATYFIGHAHAQIDASSAWQAAHSSSEDTSDGSILYETLCPGT